jgi:uncharacterized protein YndB with AHSA1/START domain
VKDAERLTFRRVMPAPPARMFALWTDPESIRKWFGGEEVEVASADLDLQPGGAYSIIRALHEQGWENCFRRQHQLLQAAEASGP